MAVRHRKETVAKSSGNSCRRCGRSYWELLPACPYCGSTNRGASSADTFETSAKPMDPRKAMKLISDNFYYIFLAFSMICAVLVVIHDIPENISNHFSDAFQSLQTKTRVLFWVIYLIQQAMFCHWLTTEYNALSSRRYTYSRISENEKLLVLCSFVDEPIPLKVPRGFDLSKARLVLQNDREPQEKTLQPYETRVYYWGNGVK